MAPRAPLLSFVAFVSFVVVACGGATADPPLDPTPAAQADQEIHPKRVPACLDLRAACDPRHDTCCAGRTCLAYTVYDVPRCFENPEPPSCRPLGEACTVGRDACCDPAAKCVEYTVYDWPRCRVEPPTTAAP